MPSLRERFIAADKQQKQSTASYNQLAALSGELAGFAATLPRALEDLLLKAEAGQPVYSTAYAPAIRAVFKTAYYPPFTGDYQGRRDMPGITEMQDLQGYRKLLEICADPDVDICVRLSFSRPSTHRNEIALTVDILPHEPFAASRLSTRGPKQQDENNFIGKDYIGTAQKPFKAPAMLTLRKTG